MSGGKGGVDVAFSAGCCVKRCTAAVWRLQVGVVCITDLLEKWVAPVELVARDVDRQV